MSTFDQRVVVIRNFLISRARLRRVTNFEEIGRVAARKLFEQGNRKSADKPVSREKVAAALAEIARTSFQKNGIILPAIVVHFDDNNPGHRFEEWSQAAGLQGNTLANHRQQVAKVFKRYALGDPWALPEVGFASGLPLEQKKSNLFAGLVSLDDAGDRNDDRNALATPWR